MQSWSEILTTVFHFRSCQGLMLEYGAMSGYDVLHKAQFSLYFRGSFTLQCSYCIEVYQCAIICNARCALCIVQLKCAIMCNCTLLCNHVSCTMCNWNVFVHSLLLHSTRNDLIKRLLLYYSFHLFLPFHLSICFFVFCFLFSISPLSSLHLFSLCDAFLLFWSSLNFSLQWFLLFLPQPEIHFLQHTRPLSVPFLYRQTCLQNTA